MTSLLPRLTAALVGAAVVLVPSAALAAGPADPAAGRPAPAGPEALPSQAAAAAGAVTGAASGAAVARAAVPARAAQEARPAAPAARAAEASAGRAAADRAVAPGTGRRATPAQPGQPGRQQRTSAQQADRAEKARPARAERPEPARKAAPSQPAARATAPDAAASDPRGNNGTFKVDGPVLDTSHGNEPQVDCAFRLNFYGYDAGQLANIVFTPIAPTPGASTAVSGRQLISSDAATGGLYNGSYPVTGTWSAADLGLDPTVRQHVKVSVESLNADGSDVPGGAKHKVFWLHPCGATAPVAVSAGGGLPQAPAVGPLAIAAAPAAQPATAPATLPVMGPQAQVLGAAATAPAALAPAVLAQAAQAPAVVLAPASLGAATLAAPQLSQPAALPFTGSPQLLALLVGGLIALLGGTALVAATRTSA